MHRSATLSAKTGHARSPRITPTWLLCTTALASGVLLASGQAFANPSGGQVVGGNASISQAPGVTTIDQKSNKAIINWQGFSIAPGETTKFKQPGRDAIALNRVRGKERSDLLGRLEANGNVWLINPNGVLVGPQAKIDVGGFLATTADIPDADFLAGRFDFSIPSPNPEAAVINQGTIFLKDKGMAALVAPHARNEGVIEGNLAQVVVAGAPTFALDFYGDGLINFEATSQVTGVTDPDQPLVENAGTIRAEGGRVLLTAEAAAGVVENVIDMSGVVEAKSFAMKGGEIVLDGRDNGIVAVAGKLDSSGLVAGERGGEVKVLGEKVGLFDGARVDVSGDAGGGTALIGGNFQGKGPENNAKRTYVGKNVKVSADAKTNGDGGKVIVWADESTEVHGTVTAKGGRESGNGGLIETSGKNLSVTAVPDASSSNGLPGTWLLDPVDITIVAGLPDPNSDNNIGNQQINAALNNGTNVTIDTSCTAPCASERGNIMQNTGATINKTAGGDATLVLDAENDILLGDSILASVGSMSVTINGDSDNSGGGAVEISGSVITNGGDISIKGVNDDNTFASGIGVTTLGAIESGGGSVFISGNSTSASGFSPGAGFDRGINVSSPIISAGGDVTLIARNVEQDGLVLFAPISTAGGNIRIDVTGPTAMTILNTLDAGAGRVTLNGGSDIDIIGQLTMAGGTLNAGGNIRFGIATGVPAIDMSASSGDLVLRADADNNGSGSIYGSGTLAMGTGGLALQAAEGIRGFSYDALYTTGVTRLAAGNTTSGDVEIYNLSTGTVSVGTVAGVSGLTNAAGEILLIAAALDLQANVQGDGRVTLWADDITQTAGTIATPELVLQNRTWNIAPSFSLTGNNQVETLWVPQNSIGGADSVDFVNGRDLTVGGITSGTVSLRVVGRLTLPPDANISATGAGTPILIRADAFTNNAGAAALQPGTGRFLVYSADPAQDNRGGLAGRKLYDSTFTTVPPGSAVLPTGNAFLYQVAPVLTVTVDSSPPRVYGDANPPLTFTVDPAGLIDNDTIDQAIVGSATTVGSDADVGTYPITPMVTSPLRYRLELVNGTLVITPAPLTARVDDKSRSYGDPDPPFTATFDPADFKLGQDQSVLGQSSFLTGATPPSPVGNYPVTITGFTNGNYTPADDSRPGTLTILPAPLIARADDKSRLFDQPNPPLTVTFDSGDFKLGQGPADLGEIDFVTDATPLSPSGEYPITVSGFENRNYILDPDSMPGMLTISSARVDVPPDVLNPIIPPFDTTPNLAQSIATTSQAIVATAPAQQHLLPQAQRAWDQEEEGLLYSNDGNRDLWGIAEIPIPTVPTE